MQAISRSLATGRQNPCIHNAIRCSSASAASDLRKKVESILDTLSLKPGGILVQNDGDSDIGKLIIELAKERKYQTLSIVADKPECPEIIEELKALGADIVVPESYTKTWYMKRLVRELSPPAGLNLREDSQATAVARAVANSGVFLTFGKKLPKYVDYGGAVRKPVEWTAFLKHKNLKVHTI
ncbi:trans-2-enoyl-CoA reductase, mitochondrial [Amborella trichopoda]|uniref:Alcohol dehydrogenase-like C-terminal domain-containing protein n=1 Tax=Amborella trichopoda TaxID=13333 RepID=W1P6T3_AMBTC|nr:trans-2-enoyl-CoA reductase, mitochondrial [Amborella trichopoda]ERN02670.1 hypothetical protein AMTR_s00085p00083580 [Amborella trichopoda]|eukprot:XP_006840995.1 trans-2-enoyl-CoA reductase, mitochondrial [Amborella trichopoda]